MASPATCCAVARCRLLPGLLARGLGPVCRQPTDAARFELQLAPPGGRGAIAAASAAVRGSARCSSSTSNGDTDRPAAKKRIVFCGTPDVAALVLQRLLAAAAQPGATFEVAGVVTQPPRPTGRGNRKVPQPSPVQVAAREAGVPTEAILAPERPGDPAFLAALRQLSPDLCVTAAYGNYLPAAFLALPPHGTLNIHPSLLPAYRGAAPVQRALQDGVAVTGVTLLFTVKAMDAGPVLAQQQLAVDPDIQAPELLARLFQLGTDLLVAKLGAVWAGQGQVAAQPQDEAAATHAAKLSREEAVLDFSQPARVCHDKVRGFAGWPGTFATFQQRAAADGGGAEAADVELKVVRTRVAAAAGWSGGCEREVAVSRDALLVRCGDGSVLEILEVQAPGKRAMAARDFANGLKGRTLRWRPLQQPAGVAA